MSKDLLAGLNPEQREAAAHRDGPLLVLAGAGSGKTRVVTHRIAHLIAQGVSPRSILAVTFTNKASREMAERVAGLLGAERGGEVHVSTFHRLGVLILREQCRHVGVPKGFSILDAGDQATALGEAMRVAGVDSERHDVRWMAARISLAKNEGLGPEDVGTSITDILGQMLREVWVAYREVLRDMGAVDFDDLLLLPLRILREQQEVLDAYRHRFRYILVDEFQDTNAVQLELVRLLAGARSNLFAVGDDDQSIYGWRGARVRNVWDFEQAFPSARVVTLARNYRSTPAILAAANGVIRHNQVRRDKTLWTEGDAGEVPRFVRVATPAAEAAWVAEELRRIRRDDRRRWSDFGVLFRMGTQARPLEEALRDAEIPYHLVGAYSFFERKEIRDALAWLRLVCNPSDDLSLRRIVAFPPSGIGPASLGRIRQWARARGVDLGDALGRAKEIPGLPTRSAVAAGRIASTLQGARESLAPGAAIAGKVGELLRDIRFREALREDASSHEEARARWRNVEHLLRHIGVFESRRGKEATLAEYLRALSLEAKDDPEPGERDEVTLMTLHAAKGLEFPVVAMVGVEEDILPHRRSAGGDVDEERRLFYVGVTRARERLLLTACRQRKRRRDRIPCRPSRFVDEIPAGAIQREAAASAPDPGEQAAKQAALDKLASIFGDS